jgi:hypothetical protein
MAMRGWLCCLKVNVGDEPVLRRCLGRLIVEGAHVAVALGGGAVGAAYPDEHVGSFIPGFLLVDGQDHDGVALASGAGQLRVTAQHGGSTGLTISVRSAGIDSRADGHEPAVVFAKEPVASLLHDLWQACWVPRSAPGLAVASPMDLWSTLGTWGPQWSGAHAVLRQLSVIGREAGRGGCSRLCCSRLCRGREARRHAGRWRLCRHAGSSRPYSSVAQQLAARS